MVFERHYGPIHRYVCRRLGASAADDVTAETFVVAFRRRAFYDPAQADARPWLFGIAANLIRHHHRAERRQLRAYARMPFERDIAEDDIDARIDDRTRGAIVARALAELREGDREILLLHAWADLSYEQIARALNVPVGTVRSRLSRARRRIRELLAANGQLLHETTVKERSDERP